MDHRYAGQPGPALDRALASSILAVLMDSYTTTVRLRVPKHVAGPVRPLPPLLLTKPCIPTTPTPPQAGGPSGGVRGQARGAVDSAFHVCGQPQVLHSGTRGRSKYCGRGLWRLFGCMFSSQGFEATIQTTLLHQPCACDWTYTNQIQLPPSGPRRPRPRATRSAGSCGRRAPRCVPAYPIWICVIHIQ